MNSLLPNLTRSSYFLISLLAGCPVNAEAVAHLCNDTVLTYADIVDLENPTSFSDLFTADGVFKTTNFSLEGKDQIEAAMTNPDRPRGTSMHVMSNILIRENDGAITGTSYYQLYAVPNRGDRPYDLDNQPVAVGVYHDVFVMEDGKCKFKERDARRTFSRS
jgi:hypothetical protein